MPGKLCIACVTLRAKSLSPTSLTHTVSEDPRRGSLTGKAICKKRPGYPLRRNELKPGPEFQLALWKGLAQTVHRWATVA